MLYGILANQDLISSAARILFLVVSLSGVLMASAYSQTASSALTGAICNVYNTIRNVIFLLGIALVVLGGAIYALGTIMPSSHKGGTQGYGMGMIIGGILGIAIALAAPYVLSVIISSTSNSILTSTGVSGVNILCSSSGLV